MIKNITRYRPRNSVHPATVAHHHDHQPIQVISTEGVGRFLRLFALLALLSAILAEPGWAQSPPAIVHIAGKVTAAGGGAPLAGAKVYLGNTTIGTATDVNGSFILKNVPLGSYELIVSCTGYELQSPAITLKVGAEYTLALVLQPLNAGG